MVVAPTVIQVSQLLGIAIVIQAGLEFLGLGSAKQASWGGMLSDAFQNIYSAPVLLLWPGLVIVLTVTASCSATLSGMPSGQRSGRKCPSPKDIRYHRLCHLSDRTPFPRRDTHRRPAVDR